LRQFARAILAVKPTASGGPIAILESGRTVITAFIQGRDDVPLSTAGLPQGAERFDLAEGIGLGSLDRVAL
jgi:hypothetical protein